MITDKEIDDYLLNNDLVRADLTSEQLSWARTDLELIKEEICGLHTPLLWQFDNLLEIRLQRNLSHHYVKPEEWDCLREMIARCQWKFAKTMPWCPHEYIVREKCALTEEEFHYFVDMQRKYGKVKRWGKHITPYLYIDDYKYWTMGAPYEETHVMNRAKVNKQ